LVLAKVNTKYVSLVVGCSKTNIVFWIKTKKAPTFPERLLNRF